MPTLNLTVASSGLGGNISRSVPITKNGGSNLDVELPPGKAGSLTTRNGDDDGEFTLGGGHGIVNTDVVDVYFEGGLRYGMEAVVNENVVALNGDGAGDNFPTENSSVVICKQVQINEYIDGSTLGALCVESSYANSLETSRVHADFQEAGDNSVTELTLQARRPRQFNVEDGDDNPFEGDPITKVMASNESVTNAGRIRALWVQGAVAE